MSTYLSSNTLEAKIIRVQLLTIKIGIYKYYGILFIRYPLAITHNHSFEEILRKFLKYVSFSFKY